MRTTVLAESRRGGKTAVIERLNLEDGKAYRVTVSQRYTSLGKAQSAFLDEAPPTVREKLSKQIKVVNESKLML